MHVTVPGIKGRVPRLPPMSFEDACKKAEESGKILGMLLPPMTNTKKFSIWRLSNDQSSREMYNRLSDGEIDGSFFAFLAYEDQFR